MNVNASTHGGTEEGTRFPGARITGDCTLLIVCAGNETLKGKSGTICCCCLFKLLWQSSMKCVANEQSHFAFYISGS